MSAVERRFAASEARLGFGGLLAACPNWLNHPRHIAAADASKPRQLVLAAQAGLRVPRTLVTNEPAQAVDFAARVGGVVACKPFGPNGFTAEDGSYRIAFASRLTVDQLNEGSIGATMHQFQEWVHAAYAVRLTVVDGRLFAAAIHLGSDAAQVDWRSDYAALTYERIEPPAEVAAGVVDLAERMRLRFAAVDFLVDRAERWHFLEIGANAQWAWIDQVADSIAEAIADALMKGACV
jgi:glutathione synthase/RimK-type ligase-like ATP-grasp enzyme